MARLFTLDEARALLPTLVPAVERLRDLVRQFRARRLALAEYHRRAQGNGKDAPAGELERLQREAEEIEARLRQEVDAITQQGVEVKDLEMGLLDFPAERGGRIVHLCWKLGESDIGFWHDIETGFAGREPL